MMSGLVQGARGLASIAYHLPGQAWRTYEMLPEEDQGALRERLRLGAYREDSTTRLLPLIVVGVIALIGYNFFVRKQ